MLELLDELAERVDGAVLFICTTRPDLFRTQPDWGGGRRNFSSVPLDPLTPDESEQLITRLLDIGELPEQVRARILSRAEGNPFFLEEIIRRLIDEGRLERRNGGWRAASAIVDADVPDTVHGVILARLDLLTDKERQAAQQAAVVGRNVLERSSL
jgi:predicted ATPase